MPAERRSTRLHEGLRGTGYVVGLGLLILLIGLLLAFGFTWVMT